MKTLRDFLALLWGLVTLPPDSPQHEIDTMTKGLKNLLEVTWIKWLLSIRSLLFLIAIALVLFFKLPGLLRAADSTSAPLDPGVLSMPAVGIVAVLIGLLVFWAILKSEAPVVDKWFDGDFEDDETQAPNHRISFRRDWMNASPNIRLCIFGGLFAVTLLSVAIVAAAAF